MNVKPHNNSKFASQGASVLSSDVAGFTAPEAGSIIRPKYGVTDLSDALKYHWKGYHLTEKMDGRWHEIRIGGSVVVGELMCDESFYAFDLPIFNGLDIRRAPRAERLAKLSGFGLQRPQEPRLGESADQFMRRVIKSGGEGVVASPLDAPFGLDIFKVKPRKDFDVRVTGKTSGAVEIEFEGQAAGKVPVSGSKLDAICIDDVIQMSAMCRTASGKFREPVFERPRPDKTL